MADVVPNIILVEQQTGWWVNCFVGATSLWRRGPSFSTVTPPRNSRGDSMVFTRVNFEGGDFLSIHFEASDEYYIVIIQENIKSFEYLSFLYWKKKVLDQISCIVRDA